MSKKIKVKKAHNPVVENRRARHDFKIEETIEAGIVLQGSEVKSCRLGKIQLLDSFAQFNNKGELLLLKAHIAEYRQGGPFFNHEVQQKRKLLLKKRELKKMKILSEQKGYTIVPLKFYFKRGWAKLLLGLAKGKAQSDKRQDLKKRDDERKMARLRDR